MKEYLQNMFNKVHRVVIGGDAGQNMRYFAKNVSVSLVGGLSAFALLFLASIIAARVLGPEEFGKYAVFFSIAQIASLFFVLELDVSALYFLAQKTKQQKIITASIIWMFLINICVFSFLALSIHHFFDFGNISLWVFVLALVMGLSLALKRMIDAFLRIDEKFTIQSLLRIVEAVSVLIVMLIGFYVLEYRAYFGYAVSIIIGGAMFSVCGLWYVRSFVVVRGWNAKKINEIFRYNAYGMINTFVNGVVKNLDKILIATFLGLSAAGIYAVYFTASVVIGARVTQIFMNVFFPSVRKNSKNNKNIYKKINKVFIKLFIPLFLCTTGGVACIVWLYGDAYQFVWTWVICGGFYIVIHFFASLYGWMLSSVSQSGYKFYNVSFVYGAVAYSTIVFFGFMLDLLSITTFFGALIAYRAVSGGFSFYALRDHV